MRVGWLQQMLSFQEVAMEHYGHGTVMMELRFRVLFVASQILENCCDCIVFCISSFVLYASFISVFNTNFTLFYLVCNDQQVIHTAGIT